MLASENEDYSEALDTSSPSSCQIVNLRVEPRRCRDYSGDRIIPMLLTPAVALAQQAGLNR
jgi:hypothetical protein